MTNYYIEKDGKIVLFDTNYERISNTLALMPQYADLEIQETERPIVDFQFADTPEYESEKTQKEQERINMLTMTALDFIGVLQQFGLTLEQINAYLEANLSVKMQLTYCQKVYCGVVKSLMPITFENVTITADMVEIAFRIKNGEHIDEGS